MAAIPAPRVGSAKAGLQSRAGSLLPALKQVGAMRFEVILGGEHLGSWSSCTGLAVKFDNASVTLTEGVVGVPGVVTPNDLTLKRALTDKGGKEVQRFLAEHWKKPRKYTAQIRLLNSYGGEVMEWKLRGVMPKEWSAPDLEASSKTVAIEKIKLAYDGFLHESEHHGPYFEVIIDGDSPLGRWTTCSGLGAKRQREKLRIDGDKEKKSKRPAKGTLETTYTDVTLTRPFSKRGWAEIEKFLVKQWQPSATPRTAKITLHGLEDLENGTIKKTEWTLRGVTPVEWKLPDLNAGKTLALVETLVLHHEGFLKTADEVDRNKAKISDGTDTLRFSGDPSVMSMTSKQNFTAWKRASPGGRKPTSPGASEFTGREPSLLDITVPLVTDSNRDMSVLDQIRLLQRWAGRTVIGGHRSPAPTPKKLTFTWNSQRFEGQLKDLTISDILWEKGVPIQAKARIELQEDPSKPKGTNPTSGGVPGHRTRLLVDGDTLPSVAFAECGSAASWRRLADANGIDDPLRVPSGARLLLPPDL